MSEEEIIKRLKNIIEINKSFLDCNIKENSNIYKDIQGLLDLYQKEKEKRDILQTNYEILQGEMDRIGIDTLRLEAGNSTDDVIEEIKKKDKIIEEMAKYMFNHIYNMTYVDTEQIKRKIEEIIQDFTNKVEKEYNNE